MTAPLHGFMAFGTPLWRTSGPKGMRVRRSCCDAGTTRKGSYANWSPRYVRLRPSRTSWHRDITPPKHVWTDS